MHLTFAASFAYSSPALGPVANDPMLPLPTHTSLHDPGDGAVPHFAARVDRDLRRACRTEAALRLILGSVARELLQRRGYRRLGFVRLADFARERLGVSARWLEDVASVAARLDDLPEIRTAFQGGELTWTQLRLLVRGSREGRDEGPGLDPEDALVDGEPPVVLRVACPSRLRALWRRACELASRMAGGSLAAWEAAEIVAAEGIAGRPAGVSVGDRVLLAFLRLARRSKRSSGSVTQDPPCSTTSPSLMPAPLMPLPPLTSDPSELDAQLRDVMSRLRRVEPEIGRLLRVLVEHRLYRSLGSRSLEEYARERLGLSLRKVWALVKVERNVRRTAPLAAAYEAGAISWVRTLTLLPVIDRSTVDAWMTRASAVTVRRLIDEVNWVLDRRDLLGSGTPLAPPPVDAVLGPPVQIGASPAPAGAWAQNVTAGQRSEVADGEVRFIGPLSVVALFRDALEVFAKAGEPRWVALERLLVRVTADWESEPRHRDPVFARDGWRCMVPACSGRRNLHDHHLQFRSRGGGNHRSNRVTVCAAHHLHGIHAGIVRARGTAPLVRWDLPFASFIGDRYLC